MIQNEEPFFLVSVRVCKRCAAGPAPIWAAMSTSVATPASLMWKRATPPESCGAVILMSIEPVKGAGAAFAFVAKAAATSASEAARIVVCLIMGTICIGSRVVSSTSHFTHHDVVIDGSARALAQNFRDDV